jgi:hypothetical protein
MRFLFVAAFALSACTTDVIVYGPDDPFWDEEYEHDEVGEEEPLSLAAPSQTVWSAATTGACTTAVVRGLAEQLIEEVECIQPGTMGRLDDVAGVTLGAATFPFAQKPAADALRAVATGRALTINSALRTVIQQFVLYTWYTRGRCTHVVSLAAPPGRSNHESGLAVDIAQYDSARTAMQSRGFRWLGSSDRVHYDYTAGGSDLRRLSVLAFQRLWNRNNPGDRISEDGAWGPQTEARAKKSPTGGFELGTACGQAVGGGGLALEVSLDVTRGDVIAAAVDPRVDRVEEHRSGSRIEVVGYSAGGAEIGRGVAFVDGGIVVRQLGRRTYEVSLLSDDAAYIEVRVDGFLLDTDSPLAARSTFNQLGARNFEVTSYDVDGNLIDRVARTFTLE